MILKKDPNSKRRSSNGPASFPDYQKDVDELLEKYRGLREEDLEPMNPYYSCVVCSKYKNTCDDGETGSSCPEAYPATEEEFALHYDF